MTNWEKAAEIVRREMGATIDLRLGTVGAAIVRIVEITLDEEDALRKQLTELFDKFSVDTTNLLEKMR